MSLPFKKGQSVRLLSAPAELLEGLPADDQRAIKALVGKQGTFVGSDDHGNLEIEFDEGADNFRTVWVAASHVADYAS